MMTGYVWWNIHIICKNKQTGTGTEQTGTGTEQTGTGTEQTGTGTEQMLFVVSEVFP